MPHISVLKKSKYLTRADVDPPVLATISKIFEDNVAKEGAPEEMRWCCSFEELEKPLVLNMTNGAIIAAITKSENTDDWPGHKIVLYDDPSVSFGGKLTGGIRVRAPRGQAAKAAKAQPKPVQKLAEPEPGDEDVPF